MSKGAVTTLFLDIGGVLLTNGWDRHMRRRAAERFGLDYQELNERHHLTFDTYESGKLSLGEYLARIVFYCERSFSPDDFPRFHVRPVPAAAGDDRAGPGTQGAATASSWWR